jgi:hypothetical protein
VRNDRATKKAAWKGNILERIDFGRVAALPQLFALPRGVLHIVVEGVPLGDVLRSPWAVAIEATRLAMAESCVLSQRDTFALMIAAHLARERIGQSELSPVRSLRDVFAERGFVFPAGL